MRRSIRLATLQRDHGPVRYAHEADQLAWLCALSEGSFAGVEGTTATVGKHAEKILIWDAPLPKSIKTITHL